MKHNRDAVIAHLDSLAVEDKQLTGRWSAATARDRCDIYADLVLQLIANEQDGSIALAMIDSVIDPWDEDPDYPVEDWQHEVANNDTRLGYVTWCSHQHEAAQR